MFELRGWTKYLYFFLKSFYLLPRWDNRVAKYLISIMLGHFHLDAEHFSWNDFKICRINAIFFFVVTVSLLLKVRMRIVSTEKGWGQMTEVNSHIFIVLGKGSSRLPVVPSLSWWNTVLVLMCKHTGLSKRAAPANLMFSVFKSPRHCSLTGLYSVPFRLPPFHLFVGFSCPVCLPVVLELLSLILGRGSGGGKDPAESY